LGHARVNGIDNQEFYYSVASLFALRGDTEKSIQTLQQAYDKGFRQRWLLEVDGRLAALHEKPAFVAIKERIANDIKQSAAVVQLSAGKQ